MQTIRMVLVVIVAGWMGLLIWRYVVKGLQGGTIRFGKRIIDGKENPKFYWFIVCAYALFWGLLCAVVWTRLMQA